MQSRDTHSRSSKFLKDLGIYAIGNLGAKVITFALIPLYTYFIHDTGDFGYFDLCFTMITLLLSFSSLQLRDGTFRFMLETTDESRWSAIVTFVYRTLTANSLIFLAIACLIQLVSPVPYMWYCYALLVVMTFYEVVTQVARGVGRNKEFAVTGILSSFAIAIYSVIFVVMLDMGIKGIFIANVLARATALLYLELKIKVLAKYFKPGINVREVGRSLLRYSIPMIPMALCWWVAGCSDRWFITHYLGLEVNGVYAVATRFTGLIFTMSFIYYQAWQETAILQYNSPDRDSFFSQMFNGYLGVLAILLVGYAFALKIFYPILVAAQYRESLNYVYPLGVSSVLCAVVFFFDLGYQCAKDTKRIMPSIVCGLIFNLVANYLLVQWFGVWGPVTVSILTYVIILVWRLHDMKRYFKLAFYPRTVIAVAVIVVSAVPFYLLEAWWLLMCYAVVACLLALMSLPKATRDDLLGRLPHKKIAPNNIK